LFGTLEYTFFSYLYTTFFSIMSFKATLFAGASLLCALTSAGPVNSTNKFATYKQYATSTYHIVDTYDSSNFFSEFTFDTDDDPTHGYVDYQSQSAASSAGLYNTNNNQIYMGVDSTNVASGRGRKSVRLSSSNTYTHGLFILDLTHMPSSTCGVWPAFWLVNFNWPAQGEIDIIEGVNRDTTDQSTLHTSAGCTIDISGSQSGSNLVNSDCNSDSGYDGCGVTNNALYGDSLNAAGGGVYATQWESSGIYVWFWPAGSVPADITSGNPITGNWGTPYVAFNGGDGCTIDDHFSDHHIVFDTTFCGDWADGAFSSDSVCSAKASSCTDYVQNNPSAFSSAYWEVNSVKVYSL